MANSSESNKLVLNCCTSSSVTSGKGTALIVLNNFAAIGELDSKNSFILSKSYPLSWYLALFLGE